MKKMIGAMLCMLAGLLAYTCSTTTVLAADWVMYDMDANAEFYYDANMSYARDGMGETPFIRIHLKVVKEKRVLEDRVYRVNPEVTWKEPMGGNVNIMMMGFEERKSFRPYEWRLVEAIKKWKDSHPRK